MRFWVKFQQLGFPFPSFLEDNVRLASIGLTFAAAALVVVPTSAQNAPADFRDDVMGQFNNSARKIASLSEAMPAELYKWSPGEGVMSVSRVYMHIARYNYMYLNENLGIAPPNGLDYSDFESITDKAKVVELLARSIEHVKRSTAHMTDEQLMAPTRLYGREVPGWSVLLQLVAHMNEHVGQSIAYARMNGIVPPWSS